MILVLCGIDQKVCQCLNSLFIERLIELLCSMKKHSDQSEQSYARCSWRKSTAVDEQLFCRGGTCISDDSCRMKQILKATVKSFS